MPGSNPIAVRGLPRVGSGGFRRLAWHRLAALVLLCFSAEFVAMMALGALAPDLDPVVEALVDSALLALLVGVPAWKFLEYPLLVALRHEQSTVAESHRLLEERVHKQDLRARLHRAMEMAESEGDALEVTRRALEQVSPEHPVEVLLADSSQAHLRRALLTEGARVGGDECEGQPREDGDAEHRYGCGVETPRGCVAARRGQPVVFPDSEALDACPRLAGRCCQPLAAVCVPLSIAGRAAGVMHLVTRREGLPDRDVVDDLQAVAAQTGARLGLLRAMEASELAASTDPLTGLLNRRSLEQRGADLDARGERYAVVMSDLDHFKRLNDTFSHAAGDRALRVYSATLQDCCRPTDIVARAGGEEFVMVLPGANAEAAAEVAERVRATLGDAAARAGSPPFTASFGVADLQVGGTLEELMRVADHALYRAKQRGRDRVEVAGAGGEAGPTLRPVEGVVA